MGPPAAAGEYLEDARVAYSAEIEVRAGTNAYRGRLFHRPGMQRRAFQGHRRYQILRFDRNKAWSVDPARRQWWPEALSAAGLLSKAQLSLVQVGEATLLGRRARIYQVSGMVSSGARFKGRIWRDRAGILLRVRLTSRAGKRRRSYHMRLISLKIGAQDRSLFRLPASYRLRAAAPRWAPARHAGKAPRGNGPRRKTSRQKGSEQSLEDLFR